MMNTTQHKPRTAQDRFGMNIAARLSEGNRDLPYDITERLRAARMQALARRKAEQTQTHTVPLLASAGGSAALMFGREPGGKWGRFASALSLLVLVAGLFAISAMQDDDIANEAAEVDTALLTDDLPPAAYTDPGFLQYLRSASSSQP